MAVAVVAGILAALPGGIAGVSAIWAARTNGEALVRAAQIAADAAKAAAKTNGNAVVQAAQEGRSGDANEHLGRRAEDADQLAPVCKSEVR